MFEYDVVVVTERSWSKTADEKWLKKVLNDRGAAGWRAVSIVNVETRGRAGKSDASLLVTFERLKQ